MPKQGIKKIDVQGISIRIEPIQEEKYVSLTDIAKKGQSEPYDLIKSWLKNTNTLLFLNEWEKLHNPDFKPDQMDRFRLDHQENRHVITAQKLIAATNAIGIISKSGRYGGTYAHPDIALNFCYWLSPIFQVYLLKEFQRMKEQEYELKNLKWHLRKITDNIDEVRFLLDTIPHLDKPGRLPRKDD